MASGVTFTIDDVEEKAGCKPWKMAEKFADEIDEEEMANASKAFAEAAGEAGDASEVAGRASEISAESGQDEYGSYHDAVENVEITDKSLQGGGEDIEAVADLINNSTDAALDTQTNVVERYRDLTERKQDHQSDAYTVLETKQEELQEDFDVKKEAAASSPDGMPATPNVTVKGETYSADGSAVGGFSFPEAAVTAIRNHFLGKAADDAKDADEYISEEIDEYRAKLTKNAADMEDLGYDVADGPHDLWYSEEAAWYNAYRLDEELEKENPDAEAVARYTNALGGATETMFDENGNVREDFDHHDSGVDEYVRKFFEEADAETLAALGNMDAGDSAPDAGAGYVQNGSPADQLAAAQRNVANGINALTNPDVGGIDTSQAGAEKDVPASVAEYVYGYDEKLDGMGVEPGSGLRSSLNEFDGFGALMSRSTVESGHGFSGDMARAAIDVQKTIEAKNDDIRDHNGSNSVAEMRSDPYSTLKSENVGGLLTAASHNEGASAHLLADEDFARDVMMREWDNGAGAGDLVRAGTTLPEGIDPNSAMARPYFNSAGNVLELAGANQERLSEINNGPWDTSELHAAIGDTAVGYMDLLAAGGTTGASGPGEVDIYGETYEHGFKLSTSDTNGLFDLMLTSDEDVSANFLEGVGAWQYGTSYGAMSGDDPNERNVLAANDAVMRVSGYVDGSFEAAEAAGLRASDLKTSMITGATTAAGLIPGVGVLPSIGGEIYRNLSDAPVQEGTELTYANDLRGDIYPRYIIASAGLDADYHGMGGEDELSTLAPESQATTDAEAQGEGQRRQDIDADNALYDLRYLESEYGYLYGHEAYTDGKERAP